jgi:next-to-BRCA1 protein 1
MFTVKATYRNETRKFSFSGTVLFPTYEELYQQVCLPLLAYLLKR